MKVKCISNKYWQHSLTIGKIYEVICFYNSHYNIIDDRSYDCAYVYQKELFKPLSKSEIRNDKINKLLE